MLLFFIGVKKTVKPCLRLTGQDKHMNSARNVYVDSVKGHLLVESFAKSFANFIAICFDIGYSKTKWCINKKSVYKIWHFIPREMMDSYAMHRYFLWIFPTLFIKLKKDVGIFIRYTRKSYSSSILHPLNRDPSSPSTLTSISSYLSQPWFLWPIQYEKRIWLKKLLLFFSNFL